jgi:glycosyltransferase involved in cell wall biosynthesis
MKNRIAFFTQNGINLMGGAERILSIVAHELVNRGFEVTIISNDIGEPAFKLDSKVKIRTLGMTFGKTKFIRRTKPILYIPRLKKILKEEKIDILIPMMAESSIMSILARYKGLEVYSWIHNSYYDPMNLQGKLFRKFFLSKVDKLIILNNTDYKAYKTHIDQVVRIPNPSYFNIDRVSALDHKVIMSAGRLDDVKGFDRLIKAFKPISDLHPKWSLKIFGDDWGEKEHLNRLILELDLTEKAFLMGSVKDIQKEYLNSDIYAMTSKFECFPMVLLEAKECGLPVVSFDCNSGPRDIINDGKDGFLVEDSNIEKFTKQLLILIENHELLEEFGKNAKINVEEFKLEKIINLWVELLDIKGD